MSVPPTSSTGSEVASEVGSDQPRYRYPWVTMIIPVAVLVLGFGGVVGLMLLFISGLDDNNSPENTLPVALIAGIVVLACTITVLLLVVARLGLASRDHELGLPAGSVRALLALTFVLLFFILAVFLFVNAKSLTEFQSTGLTQEQVDAIAPDRLVAVTAVDNPEGPTLYNVTQLVDDEEISGDLARQLVTLVGTLVASIASFYFGANSVQKAFEVAQGSIPGTGGTESDQGSGGDGDGDSDVLEHPENLADDAEIHDELEDVDDTAIPDDDGAASDTKIPSDDAVTGGSDPTLATTEDAVSGGRDPAAEGDD